MTADGNDPVFTFDAIAFGKKEEKRKKRERLSPWHDAIRSREKERERAEKDIMARTKSY